MMSLRLRLNRGLALILFTLFIVQWLAADWVIRKVAEKEMMTRLEHDSDSLLATLKPNEHGDVDYDIVRIPLVYDQKFSGHYFIIQIDGRISKSASLANQTLPAENIAAGQLKRYYLSGPQEQPLLVYGRGRVKYGHVIILTVAEDLTEIRNDLFKIRLGYLAFTVVILILAIALQSKDVKKAIRPLRKVEMELSKIADGQQHQILTEVPTEIEPLVNEINRLIVLVQRRLQQSRTAIGNLAHALKTPLAVMVRLTENQGFQSHPELTVLLTSQLETIQNRIERELKRARLAGHIQSGSSFNPYQELTFLTSLLKNIYCGKHLETIIDAPDSLIPFDREDMLEIIGNLADNACKWANAVVKITVTHQQQLIIQVEDDGPGCPEHLLKQLIRRGVRLDESVQGHGLGLAIVRDVVEFYDGRISLALSENLGGLSATVVF